MDYDEITGYPVFVKIGEPSNKETLRLEPPSTEEEMERDKNKYNA